MERVSEGRFSIFSEFISNVFNFWFMWDVGILETGIRICFSLSTLAQPHQRDLKQRGATLLMLWTKKFHSRVCDLLEGIVWISKVSGWICISKLLCKTVPERPESSSTVWWQAALLADVGKNSLVRDKASLISNRPRGSLGLTGTKMRKVSTACKAKKRIRVRSDSRVCHSLIVKLTPER